MGNIKTNMYGPERRQLVNKGNDDDTFRYHKGSDFVKKTKVGRVLAERSAFMSKVQDVEFVKG